MLGEFSHLAASCGTLTELGEQFRRQVAAQGFTSSACRAFVPTAKGTDFRILFRDWPAGWAHVSDQRGFAAQNSVVSEAHRRMTPFTWRDVRRRTAVATRDREVWESVMAFGLRNGFVQPVHGPNRYVAIVSMATPERDIDLNPDWRVRLQALSLCVHERAMTLAGSAALDGPKQALTPRELECLRWVADGRTDREVGDILSISATTVKFHLNHARAKLGARTRAQAVARLVQYGLY
jgi:LuxR family quorum sensing-dependent transcriptional regulator